MTELLIAEEHSQLYDLWIERGIRNISVCHIDFHCDMRGLLIERRLRKARFVWKHDPSMNRLDSGSFLAHAIMKGIVSSLRWVHDDFGGRKCDNLYCVKYETDFSAIPFLVFGRKSWVPFSFSEHNFVDWGGSHPGEVLSIDWDAVAYVDYDESLVRRLTADILDRESTPESIFVARSPEYCHPDRALFDNFITALEKKFKTLAVYLPPKVHPPLVLTRSWNFYHQIEFRMLKKMRKRGIY